MGFENPEASRYVRIMNKMPTMEIEDAIRSVMAMIRCCSGVRAGAMIAILKESLMDVVLRCPIESGPPLQDSPAQSHYPQARDR